MQMGFLHSPPCVELGRPRWIPMDWSPDPLWSRSQHPSPELLFFACLHHNIVDTAGFQLAISTGVAEYGNIPIDHPSSG